MLFMMICTWDPQDEREVRSKRANWEWPKEVRVISEYFDLQGCRTIYVVDCDAVGLIACRAAWINLLMFEIFPVWPIGATKEQVKKLGA
jgi:hypothetical protein